jgi:RNA polymerase sigma factor (sigma-70 family)
MPRQEVLTDELLVESIKKNERRALEEFYTSGKVSFSKWAMKHFQCDEDEITDTYQDAVTILYENILSGRYVYGGSNLKTYLYGIAKNLFYRKIEKAKKIKALTIDIPDTTISWFEAESENEQKLSAAQKAFSLMKDPCKSILNFFYYHHLSMAEIAARLGYKSDTVVKSQKVRCLKTLKDETLKYISHD